jgi:predicted oxidoreductase
MRTIALGRSGLRVPVVAVGCMRMSRLQPAEAERFVQEALELGANFFDHADIYGGGRCEEMFAAAVHMSADVRERLIIQSKCGIRRGMYDFSREHILESVDGILRRLRTDYLDVLLLHRPDALVEPEEVAEAFDRLQAAGKVRHFGVSNHNPGQIQLLQQALRQPVVANQLQMSIAHATAITAGLNVNMTNEAGTVRDGGVVDFCRLHEITLQPWSPFQHGFFAGSFLNNEKFPELNAKIREVADRHGVGGTAIAIAWLLRHPARMQPVIGTMQLERLRDAVRAADVQLSRTEWYELLLAAGNRLP